MVIFVINAIPNNSNNGNGGAGADGIDKGVSEDPGKEDSGSGRSCINIWVRGENNQWQIAAYCG
jgi:hypothetical protein